MPKRKKPPSEIIRDEDVSPGNTGTKKRKKSLQYDPIDICQDLYEIIRNHKTDDGRLLCEAFIRAPKRRSLADYYDVVTTPIDLLKIQQKLKTEEYEELDQLTADIELMINNAKTYYKRNSQEYRDACDMWDLYIDSKNRLLAETFGEDSNKRDENSRELNTSYRTEDGDKHDDKFSDNPGIDEDNPFEELFAAIMTYTDSSGRVLSEPFQLLPSKHKYPEYYEVIHDPMDLKMIATKIQNNEYCTLNDLERDLLLMVKNAKTFNEPGSTIYKDAVMLKRVITSKKYEIEHSRLHPVKSSDRIRSKRMLGGHRLSAITAALQYTSDDESEAGSCHENVIPMEYEEEEGSENESSVAEMDSSILWQLYDIVRKQRNSLGAVLAESFMKLPSKRIYPDYYEEITKPICLTVVRKNIKTGVYQSLEELVTDFSLIFENAKQYNRPDSRLYKDACKLQKNMRIKAKELSRCDIKREHDSEDDVNDEKTPKRGRGRKSLGTPASASGERKKPTKKIFDMEAALKKRFRLLFKTLLEYQDENGRFLIPIFMEKPSNKDYPDYYQVISEPIDMKMIEDNIKSEKYHNEEGLIQDLNLMFNNAKHYNEEHSQVYKDATTLEKVFLDTLKNLGPINESPRIGRPPGKKSKVKCLSPLAQKLREMYDTIKDFSDSKGRKLSTIFMKLPAKNEYPDYYEIIKKPIDMLRIYARTQANQYDSLEDLVSDFVLMFDNACRYNEPDSHIYKDALMLQRVLLQKKAELSGDDSGVPDIKALVQELLTNLFVSLFNHQDEEGRCYSDSLAELPVPEKSQDPDKENKLNNFDTIKKKLDKGCYLRLDRFQDDIFEVFERARKLSRTDSQIYEDAVELQLFFIKIRDELCKNGELLLSPALSYTEKELQLTLEAERTEKLPSESKEDQEKELQQQRDYKFYESEKNKQGSVDSINYQDQTYRIGDFVYVEPRASNSQRDLCNREKGSEPHIVCIEKLWTDGNGEKWLYGSWFYRPKETFHLATRKFLEKEVFKSDYYDSVHIARVLGKCFVMFVKDYFKSKPEGIPDKDVYVCESRYQAKAKSFKKIKIWSMPYNNHVKIVTRDQPLTPVRVPSVFAEKNRDDHIESDDGEMKIIDKLRESIEMDVPNPEEGCTYYEQFNTAAGCFKLGDCVYLRSQGDKPYIGRIDKMWVDKGGNSFFHGPWFVRPSDVDHPPTRLFYKREVFLSSIEDTNPILSITGRCAVMAFKEYISSRVTEIPEPDVYVCESRYLEAERQIRKLPKGLKRYQLSPRVVDDEIYFFKKPITPQKEPSPLLMKVAQYSDVEEEKPEVPDNDLGNTSQQQSASQKKMQQKFKYKAIDQLKGRRQPSGYILYSSEIRKSIMLAHPDYSFGEISRIVGQEWRNLSTIQKAEYEERAQKIADEQTLQEANQLLNDSFYPQSPSSGHGDVVYECLWDSCDFQFEDLQDLCDHLLMEGTGHLHISTADGDLHCLWANCTRAKKDPKPFPSLARLVRHCKEVHLRISGKGLHHNNKNRNFFSIRSVPSLSSASSGPMTPGQPGVTSGMASMSGPGCMSQGMFPFMQGYGQEQGMYQGSFIPNQGFPMNYGGGVLLHPPYHPGMFSSPQPHNLHYARAESDATLPYQVLTLEQPQINGGQYHFHSTRPADPMFTAVPPKSQRLLHSEAYIRYIEGLQTEKKSISNWDDELKATPDNTSLSESGRLPIHWLANGVGNHGNAVNALWALRELMLRDALNIAKVL